MSQTLVVITGLIYLWIAVEQFINGNTSMAIVYSGYAWSNFGLCILVK